MVGRIYIDFPIIFNNGNVAPDPLFLPNRIGYTFRPMWIISKTREHICFVSLKNGILGWCEGAAGKGTQLPSLRT